MGARAWTRWSSRRPTRTSVTSSLSTRTSRTPLSVLTTMSKFVALREQGVLGNHLQRAGPGTAFSWFPGTFPWFFRSYPTPFIQDICFFFVPRFVFAAYGHPMGPERPRTRLSSFFYLLIVQALQNAF